MDAIVIAALVFFGSVNLLPQWLERRRAVEQAEQAILKARAVMDSPVVYRPLQAGETTFIVQLKAAAPQLDAIASELRPLGDFVIEASGEGMQVMRAFTDASGRMMLTAHLGTEIPPKVTLTLVSFSPDGQEWVTRKPPTPPYDMPYIERQVVAEEAAIGEMVAAHRAFVPEGTELVVFASGEDVVREGEREQARFVEWRRVQTPDALLRMDLIWLLGEEYAAFGPMWKQRLQRFGLPVAQVRRR